IPLAQSGLKKPSQIAPAQSKIVPPASGPTDSADLDVFNIRTGEEELDFGEGLLVGGSASASKQAEASNKPLLSLKRQSAVENGVHPAPAGSKLDVSSQSSISAGGGPKSAAARPQSAVKPPSQLARPQSKAVAVTPAPADSADLDVFNIKTGEDELDFG